MNCTDIKATVAEKTLLVTFISVVCIVYMKSLLNEVLLHEELCYLSVFTWFMVVSCICQYQKYPCRKWYLSGVRICGTRVLVLSVAILEFCTVWEHSTVGSCVATAGTQGNGKPSVSRGYQTLFSSFQGSTSSSKPGTCSRVLFCSCMDPRKLLIAHNLYPWNVLSALND